MRGAQASYLATLCEEAKLERPGGNLTKAQASKLIDELKTRLGRLSRDRFKKKRDPPINRCQACRDGIS